VTSTPEVVGINKRQRIWQPLGHDAQGSFCIVESETQQDERQSTAAVPKLKQLFACSKSAKEIPQLAHEAGYYLAQV
jgi:hypothetical protein